MSKREERKLKASFIVGGGSLLAIHLHNWGVGWILSLILGTVFITFLWLGMVWFIKNSFGN